MFIYIPIFIICCILFNEATKNVNKWNFFAFIGISITSLLAGGRAIEIGTDTENYYNIYQELINLPSIQDIYDSSKSELLYKLLSILASRIQFFSLILIVYQFLTITFLYNILYKVRNYVFVGLAFWLYYMYFFNLSLNIMRQVCAIFYVINISFFLLNGKPKKYLIYSLFSVFIHTSALIACFIIFLIYCISNKSFKLARLYSIIYVVALSLIFVLFAKLSSFLELLPFIRFQSYIDYTQTGDGYISSSDIFLRLLCLCVFFISMYTGIINKKYSLILFLLCFTELTIYCTSYFNKWLYRNSYYYFPFILYAVCFFTHSKRFTFSSKIILNTAIFLLSLSYWLYIYIIVGSNDTANYSFSLIYD